MTAGSDLSYDDSDLAKVAAGSMVTEVDSNSFDDSDSAGLDSTKTDFGSASTALAGSGYESSALGFDSLFAGLD